MKDIVMRYYLRDGDIAYAQVPMEYCDNSYSVSGGHESYECTFWDCPVIQTEGEAGHYIEATRDKLRLTDAEITELISTGGIEPQKSDEHLVAMIEGITEYVDSIVGLQNVKGLRERKHLLSIDLWSGDSYVMILNHCKSAYKDKL